MKRRTQFLKNITKFGDKYSKNVWNDLKNPFWINVITYYYTYFSKYVLKSSNELNATIFLYNGNKVIGNRPITNSKLAKNGPFQIRQIKNDISYLTLQGLNRQFEINLNFLQYNSLINAINIHCWRFKCLKVLKEIEYQPFLNIIMQTNKGSSQNTWKLLWAFRLQEMVQSNSYIKIILG